MRIRKSTSAFSTAEELSKAWEFVNNEAELAYCTAGFLLSAKTCGRSVSAPRVPDLVWATG